MMDHFPPAHRGDVERYLANRDLLTRAHAYDPTTERDACGVGLVCAIDGQPRREVVELAIRALKAVWHRGAVDADGKTGDGAGIYLEIPQDFLREQIRGSKQSCPPRRRPGPSSRPRPCASASTSTAGARCRWTPR